MEQAQAEKVFEEIRLKEEDEKRIKAEEKARIQAEEKRVKEEEKARIQAEEKARIHAEEKAMIHAEEKRIKEEEKARINAEEKRIKAEDAKRQAEKEAEQKRILLAAKELKYSPGTYRILQKTVFRGTSRIEGSVLQVGPLEVGEAVQVDRVEKVDQRWRARILDTTYWFTIEKISTGKIYAELSIVERTDDPNENGEDLDLELDAKQGNTKQEEISFLEDILPPGWERGFDPDNPQEEFYKLPDVKKNSRKRKHAIPPKGPKKKKKKTKKTGRKQKKNKKSKSEPKSYKRRKTASGDTVSFQYFYTGQGAR